MASKVGIREAAKAIMMARAMFAMEKVSIEKNDTDSIVRFAEFATSLNLQHCPARGEV